MADTITANLIENGPRNFVYRFTSLSDGTGETGVAKVDGSATGPLGVTIAGNTVFPGIYIRLRSLQYNVKGMALRILWDATTPVDAVILSEGSDKLDFRNIGSFGIPAGTIGATGKILFTTVGAMPNSAYTVILRGFKGIPQN